jgi:hypothetical protein
MRARQDAGFENDLFLRLVSEREVGKDSPRASMTEAAEEVTRVPARPDAVDPPGFTATSRNEAGIKLETDIGASIATGLGFGLLSIVGSVADGLVGSTPPPKVQRADPKPKAKFDLFDAAVAEGRDRQRREQEEADREWRKRQRSYGE